MSELELQRIITILWILYGASVTPANWHLLMPIVALLLEARAFARDIQNRRPTK